MHVPGLIRDISSLLPLQFCVLSPCSISLHILCVTQDTVFPYDLQLLLPLNFGILAQIWRHPENLSHVFTSLFFLKSLLLSSSTLCTILASSGIFYFSVLQIPQLSPLPLFMGSALHQSWLKCTYRAPNHVLDKTKTISDRNPFFGHRRLFG